MKTLIINGSPRKNGDTAVLLTELKKYLAGEIIEISAYYNNIKPCIDCRYCWKNAKCAIIDDMDFIYNDDFDNVVIASPIYLSGLTGPLTSLASRLQVYYAAKRFLKKEIEVKAKTGVLILVGGGDGKVEHAVKTANWMFKKMNAICQDENRVFSLKTDDIPAFKDLKAQEKVKEIAENLNNKQKKC